jgi:predicted phosphodiesterase
MRVYYTDEMRRHLDNVVKVNKAISPHNLWNNVTNAFNERFGTNLSRDAIRLQWRKQNHKTLVPQLAKQAQERNLTTLRDLLLSKIKSKRDLSLLAHELSVTVDAILLEVSRLQLNGYRGVTVWQEQGKMFIQNVITKGSVQNVRELPTFAKTIRIGVVSDTHIGNKNFDRCALDYLYDYFDELGIKTVLHVGDLTDGYYSNRPTSILEQDAIGFDQQLRLFCEVYPKREGITTYAISGNHDFTFTREAFANIGEAIEARRSDIRYLGHNFAKFPLNDKSAISLIHPTDGTPQSLSLRLQQIIDRNEHRVSDIILVGHYHKFVQIYYKGVYGYLVPSLERQTGFMSDNNLTSLVGGLVLTIKVDDEGYIMSVTTEYVALD